MILPNYYQNVIVFAILGLISGILFDFFRSFRKASTSKSDFIVILQDIIYLTIITICIILSIYYFIDDDIRLYMIVSFILSIYVYEKLVSKYIICFFTAFLKKISSIISFVITIKIHLEFSKKIIIFLHKFVKKCCIKIIYMVTYICKKLDFIHKLKPKKKVKNEKKRRKRKKNNDV